MTLNRLSAVVALMALGATASPADAQTKRSDAWQLDGGHVASFLPRDLTRGRLLAVHAHGRVE